jgi:hypothetical protein
MPAPRQPPTVGHPVVGAREVGARQHEPHSAAPRTIVVAVVADQAMGEIPAPRGASGEVRLVRGGDDLDLAELARDQRRLRRTDHAHRGVFRRRRGW